YENREIPPLILLPEEAEPLLPILNDLFQKPEDYQKISRVMRPQLVRTSIEIPKRGDKKRLLDISLQNAVHTFNDQQRDADVQHHTLIALQDLLKLSPSPKWIECFDISHLQGSHVVASGVAFIDGKPEKTLYRQYNVQFEQDFRNDDFQ